MPFNVLYYVVFAPLCSLFPVVPTVMLIFDKFYSKVSSDMPVNYEHLFFLFPLLLSPPPLFSLPSWLNYFSLTIYKPAPLLAVETGRGAIFRSSGIVCQTLATSVQMSPSFPVLVDHSYVLGGNLFFFLLSDLHPSLAYNEYKLNFFFFFFFLNHI